MSIKPPMSPGAQFKVIALTFFSIVVIAGVIAQVSVMTSEAMANHHPKKDGHAATSAAHDDKSHDTKATTPAHDDKSHETKAAAPSGDKVAGAKVFASKTCTACHAVSSLPGANGAVGPKLDGLGATASTRVSGLSAEDYIKQSIEKPSAFVVTGFAPSMPELRASMNDQEFNDLVAYLASL